MEAETGSLHNGGGTSARPAKTPLLNDHQINTSIEPAIITAHISIL